MTSEIVVGIDFGTTYSGVSWAINGGNKTVRVINDWPNPTSTVATSDKVPTIISYPNGVSPQWGFSVDDVKKDGFRWIKLLLDPKIEIARNSEAVLTSMKLLSLTGKTAEDVATDYIRMIWNYTKNDIQKHRGDHWEDIYTPRVVLTVPAIWSPAAKDKTLRIARKAGLPQDIQLVTEPEAAALAVLKEKSEDHEPLQIGDCFVVCDAGGGTVDLISYRIVGLNPLAVEECAVGDGGLCGSVYLDQAFEKYIRTIVGETQWQGIREKSKKKMMREFELSIKRSYAGDEQEYSVDLQGVEDDPSWGIDDDTITLKPSVLKTVFDHVIGQIKTLVENQIDEAQDNGNIVKALLLVGGFGTNRYMHNQLKDAYKRVGIQVLQNNGAWSSICRGATLWGLENSNTNRPPQKTVRARISRYSYGTVFMFPFDVSKGHRIEDRILSPDGQYRAINQMVWFIKKGDKVMEGKEHEISFIDHFQVGLLSTGNKNYSNDLYYCADDIPPTRKDNSVKKLCSVEYAIKTSKLRREASFRSPNTDEKWKEATFVLRVGVGNATLSFSVSYKGEQLGEVEARYREEIS